MVDVLDCLWIFEFIENLSKVPKTCSLNTTSMVPGDVGRVARQ